MVNLKIDKDRLLSTLTLDEIIGMQEKDFRTVRSGLGKFVVDDAGNYVPVDEGQKMIGALTMADLNQTLETFFRDIGGALVPPTSAGG